jgi:hypothetical protein
MVTRSTRIVNVSLFILVAILAVARFGPVLARREEPRLAPQHSVKNLPLDFAAPRKTLVLVVKSSCPYCTASMEFYKRLANLDRVRSDQVRFVVAGPEPVPVLARYITGHGLHSKQIVTADVPGVSGTPTLFIVDKTGVIEAVWVGKLQPWTEQDVIDAVKGAD